DDDTAGDDETSSDDDDTSDDSDGEAGGSTPTRPQVPGIAGGGCECGVGDLQTGGPGLIAVVLFGLVTVRRLRWTW
ncbi:MAG TPA: hypothetical protein DIU15_06225, partial [Deltaproteobacteria bacterium]|nr:hypothetical protein [Deltaproteobacteria bacterium]